MEAGELTAQEQLLRVMENVASGSVELFSKLTPAGRAYLVAEAHNLFDDSATLEALYSVDYERYPVAPETFLSSTDYIGHIKCWPAWIPEFVAVCRPYSGVRELILTGAQAAGKTMFAMMVNAYKMYRLSCMRRPAEFYGLAAGTQITFGLYAMTKKQIERCGFFALRDVIIDQSPYFREVFPRLPYGKETIEWDIPGRRMLVETGSGRLHAIGRALFAIAADELNYYDRGERTAVHARELVEEVSTRLGSRFVDYAGDIPGIACFVSQTRTSADFLEERIRAVKNLPGVKVCRGPRWKYNPTGYMHPDGFHEHEDPSFRVYVGDEIHDPRILDDAKQLPDGSWRITARASDADEVASIPPEKIIRVPINHYREHLSDLPGALRLIDDVATGNFTPFFPRREVVNEMFDPSLPFPFSTQVVPCYEGSSIVLATAFDARRVTSIQMGRNAPIRHPDAPRYIHLDPAQGGGVGYDRMGVAMAHASEFYITKREGAEEDEAGVGALQSMKSVELDFYVGLEGSPFGAPIDYEKLRVFLEWLRGIGYWIKKITSDTYQSFEMLQRLRDLGFETEVLSMDRTSKPYKIARAVANEGRIKVPCPPGHRPSDHSGDLGAALRDVLLFKELCSLEEDVKRDKVDHPKTFPDGSRGSKDIADGTMGAVYSCLMDDTKPGRPPEAVTGMMGARSRLNRYLAQVERFAED